MEETFTLSNGVKIPKLGLGTWLLPDGEAARVVLDALEVGYRHFDTAQAYENERGVGEGLRGSGLSRDRFFVTTKLSAECKNYAEAKDHIEDSLKALGLDQIETAVQVGAQRELAGLGQARAGRHRRFDDALEQQRAAVGADLDDVFAGI